MIEKNSEVTDVELLQTITDDQIITERRLPRRSFLSATGVLLGSRRRDRFGCTNHDLARTRLRTIRIRNLPIPTRSLQIRITNPPILTNPKLKVQIPN